MMCSAEGLNGPVVGQHFWTGDKLPKNMEGYSLTWRMIIILEYYRLFKRTTRARSITILFKKRT